MYIHVKIFATLLWFFFGIAGPLHASPTPEFPSNPEGAPLNSPLSCNEPAPVNYHITDISTNEIRVAWDAPINPPFEYNIKVWETSTGNLVQNGNISGLLNVARGVGLQPGTEYRIRSTPVCSDGSLSVNYTEGVGTTLIVDLVVSIYNENYTPPSCALRAPNETCAVNPNPGNTVSCKVQRRPKFSNQGPERIFGVYKVSATCLYPVVKVPEANSPFQFTCTNGQTECTGSTVVIRIESDTIAEFKFNKPANGPQQIVCVKMHQQYEIICWGTTGTADPNPVTCPGTPTIKLPSGGERNEDSENIATASLSVLPNPFTNQLEVQIPFANINENTELSLYDLQGRRMMDLITPGDQQSITLTTENLTPGMYFLRAESGGMIQTVKVVKTQ